MRYLLSIAYDGTLYSGWQIQPNAISIQELIQDALSKILQTKTHITGSGRTDAGVHADDQKAHFETSAPIDTVKTLFSLNALLPPAIRILSLVPTELHARYSATSKIYTYRIHNAPHLHPLKRHYTTHIRRPLDIDALKLAATHFVGTHDFTTFTNHGTNIKDHTRTIYAIDIQDDFTIRFHGSGFLYKMVRNIVGALLHVAGGKELDIQVLLRAKNRRLAPPPAPACGLTLTAVDYTENS
jgi:tRNA pseudouridine38-40 synthase